MKSKNTDVSFIIDRSGSMGTKIEQVVTGFNEFIREQRELEGECFISFFQFDDEFDIVYESKNVNDVELMTQKDFSPRGMTALYDAIGRVINILGDRYRNMNEDDRPENVIVGVITDGQENASREFTQDEIKEMISHQESKYNWNIIFLSEDIDAVEDSANYFNVSNTMSVGDIGSGMKKMSGYVNYSRTVNSNATLQDVEDELDDELDDES